MDRDLHGYIAKKFDLIAGRLGGWHSEGGTELDGIVTDLTEEVYGAICLAVEARNAMDRKFPQYATHDSIGEPV